jgi:hypothetical protein
MLGSKNLTGETPRQVYTFPGQAHFAIPSAKKRCGDCWFWSPKRAGDKRAICGKAASMSHGARQPAIPNTAFICQYFTETKPEI